MLISPAYAQGAGGGADMLTSFLPLILIFVVFYFLLIRPQQKKQKQHKEMLAAIRRGDKIVTAGGIIGTVAKVIGDDEVSVEIAEGVKVKVARGMISAVLSKTEPAKSSADDKDDEEEEIKKD
ncbi:preprotein translocase subunit YajC [Thalassospira sp.]|uniref:preprotein translocase subunit YajC n=1 Tax=Thalassospira sp. TaxID=1912094 RepID=UPI002735E34C|nr:preprotein translocase subunit YajC [Thalassospira sp.]MDP2697960.1 preprotein translocase subunit YajC [Thalassospira sp.]